METKDYVAAINKASVKHWSKLLETKEQRVLLDRLYIHPEPGATMAAIVHPQGALSRRYEQHRISADQLTGLWGEYVYEGSVRYLAAANKNFTLFDYLPCLHELGRTLSSDGCSGTKLPMLPAIKYLSELPEKVIGPLLTKQRESVLANLSNKCGYDDSDEYLLEQAKRVMWDNDLKHEAPQGYFCHGWRDDYGDSLHGNTGTCLEIRRTEDIAEFIKQFREVCPAAAPYDILPGRLKLPFIQDIEESGMVWTVLHKHSHNPTGTRWVRMRIGKALRAAFPWMKDDLVRRLSMLASTPKMFRGRDMRLFKLAYLNNYDLTGSCMGHNDVTDYGTGMLYPWMCYALSNYEIALAVQPNASNDIAELDHKDVIGYTLLLDGESVGTVYGDYDRVGAMMHANGIGNAPDMSSADMPLVAVPCMDEICSELTLVVPYIDSLGWLWVNTGSLKSVNNEHRGTSVDCQNSGGAVYVDVADLSSADIRKAFDNYAELMRRQAELLGISAHSLDSIRVHVELDLDEPGTLLYVKAKSNNRLHLAQKAVLDYSRALAC